MASPNFRTDFEPRYGECVALAPGISRITCNNPSPFTFHGTNTYLLGTDDLAIIDPGPENDEHFQALEKAIGNRTVSKIIITHTHADHSPLAARLAEETGAQTVAEGSHRPARALHIGESNPLDASADREFAPDITVSHGDIVEGDGWSLTTLLSPGHTANHASFALNGTDHLFSGDHVMAWATSIVAPPDGAMSDYMRSLDIMLEQSQSVYFPGHGGRLTNAHQFVRALRTHRKMRETAVLDQIVKGQRTIPEMVAIIYRNTDKRLHGAAGLSVMAHLEDLVARGVVATDGHVSIDGEYHPA